MSACLSQLALGKTPAEACGIRIEVKGKNKWLTLIQNASQSEPSIST
jgi:hypothetical protein